MGWGQDLGLGQGWGLGQGQLTEDATHKHLEGSFQGKESSQPNVCLRQQLRQLGAWLDVRVVNGEGDTRDENDKHHQRLPAGAHQNVAARTAQDSSRAAAEARDTVQRKLDVCLLVCLNEGQDEGEGEGEEGKGRG